MADYKKGLTGDANNDITNYTEYGNQNKDLVNKYMDRWDEETNQLGGYTYDDQHFDLDAYMRELGNRRIAETGGRTLQQDTSKYYFGGDEDWANNYYNQMMNNAAAAGQRGAPTLDRYSADLSGVNLGYATQGMSRGQQMDALGAMGGDVNNLRAVAEGRAGPSMAELAMRNASEDAYRMQLSQAAAAGGASAASARLASMQNNAGIQGQLTRDLGVQRAAEQAQAREQLIGAQNYLQSGYGDVYGQDIASTGLAADVAFQASQQQIDQAETAADIAQKQTAMNDALVQYYISQGYSAMAAQMQATSAMDSSRVSTELQKTINEYRPEKSWAEKLSEAGPIVGAVADTGVGIYNAFKEDDDKEGDKESSDIRAKKNIKGAEKETADFMRKLGDTQSSTVAALGGPSATAETFRNASASGYEYKDPKNGTGTHYGPMAQELEQTPVGRSVVETGPNGKQIDTGRLTLVNTSELGNQRREIDALKAQMATQYDRAPMPPPSMAALGPAAPPPAAVAALANSRRFAPRPLAPSPYGPPAARTGALAPDPYAPMPPRPVGLAAAALR